MSGPNAATQGQSGAGRGTLCQTEFLRRAEGYLPQANREVLVWCETTAGLRKHGTTKEQPLTRFQEVEQGRLQALPTIRYEIAIWKQLKLGRDCYVEVESSYYSAPHRLVGQKLWVCLTLSAVRLFDPDHQLLATHERAAKPGTRQTHIDHLPPEKVPGLLLDRTQCLQQAQEIGPKTTEIVSIYLADQVIDRLSTVGRLLRLKERYDAPRLEAACKRALAFGDPNYGTIKAILKQGLQDVPHLSSPTSPSATAFVRSPEDLFGPDLGEARWN